MEISVDDRRLVIEIIAKLVNLNNTMAAMDDHHKRGYMLQDLLNRVFDLHDIALVRPFVRNDGAEQIDGAFKMDGWHYIVECRWREKLANTRELDGLVGQVTRSGKQTMGLFLSINGWSSNVPETLKQNPHKSVFLMEGCDLRSVLSRDVNLRELLSAKLSKFNIEAEPYYSAAEFTSR